MTSIHRLPLRAVVALALLAVLPGAVAPVVLAGPVWVVDPCNVGCWRIDPSTEKVLGFVDLSDGDPGGAPAPTGVAFATIPGEGARWAFVAQGPLLRVVRVADGTVVRTVDLAAYLGLPGLRLERLDGAPARWAKAAAGGWRWEVALWIVANREDAGRNEPWFVVLDQEALVDGTPLFLLGHERMCPPEDPACEYRAVDVRVATGAAGYLVQTALATAVLDEAGSRAGVLALSRDVSPEGPWRVRLLREEPTAPGGGPPRLGVDVPQARPGGHVAVERASRLVNARERDAACDFKEPVADVALWGPGPRGMVDGGKDARVYHDLVLLAPAPAGSAGQILSVPAGTCLDLGEPGAIGTDVGHDPAGITLTSKLRDEAKILVSNRGDGTVSVIGYDELGDDPRTLALGAGSCPGDIAAGMEKARSWVIDDLRFVVGPGGSDPHLEWSAGPMEDGTVYRVYEAPMSTGDEGRGDGGVTPPKPTGPWIPLGQTVDRSWPLDLVPQSRAYLVEILE